MHLFTLKPHEVILISSKAHTQGTSDSFADRFDHINVVSHGLECPRVLRPGGKKVTANSIEISFQHGRYFICILTLVAASLNQPESPLRRGGI